MKEMILALLTAISAVESSNGLDPKAKGNSLQIMPICVRDVNRIYGTSYTMRDVVDSAKAREIAVLYLSYWGPRKAPHPTEETFARIWHRGPTNWRDALGTAYWKRVKAKMKGNRKK